MKTVSVFIGVILAVSNVYASEPSMGAIATEMERIKEDEEKIQKYIRDGADKSLFTQSLRDLKARKAQLLELRKSGEKKEKLASASKKRPVQRTPAGNIPIGQRTKGAEAPQSTPTVPPVASEPTPSSAPAAPAATIAPSPSSPFKLGFMFDGYYTYMSTQPAPGTAIPYRYYDINHNDFTLNLLELNASGSMKRLSYRFDLDFGDFAEQNTTDSVSKHIGQAYATYDFGFEKPVTLTFGKFYTHVGFEVAKAQENLNYSRAFAFSFGGPFWHEGIALNGTLPSGVVFGAYLYDRWDGRLDQNNGKTLGWRLGYTADGFSIYYNGISGPEQTSINSNKKTVHEVNASYTINDKLLVAADALVGTDQNALGAGTDSAWWALVTYASFQATSTYKLNSRVEYFRDRAGAIFGTPTGVLGVSLDNSFKLMDGAEFRLEGRVDSAERPIFFKPDGSAINTRYSITGALLFTL